MLSDDELDLWPRPSVLQKMKQVVSVRYLRCQVHHNRGQSLPDGLLSKNQRNGFVEFSLVCRYQGVSDCRELTELMAAAMAGKDGITLGRFAFVDVVIETAY